MPESENSRIWSLLHPNRQLSSPVTPSLWLSNFLLILLSLCFPGIKRGRSGSKARPGGETYPGQREEEEKTIRTEEEKEWGKKALLHRAHLYLTHLSKSPVFWFYEGKSYIFSAWWTVAPAFCWFRGQAFRKKNHRRIVSNVLMGIFMAKRRRTVFIKL